MTATDDALDKAKGKLQGETALIPTREKNPRYHVFLQSGPDQHLEHLTKSGPVNASSRKAAIATFE